MLSLVIDPVWMIWTLKLDLLFFHVRHQNQPAVIPPPPLRLIFSNYGRRKTRFLLGQAPI
jgi:hypothetical protein